MAGELVKFNDYTKYETASFAVGSITGAIAGIKYIIHEQQPHNRAQSRLQSLEHHLSQIQRVRADVPKNAPADVKSFFTQDYEHYSYEATNASILMPLGPNLYDELVEIVVPTLIGGLTVAAAATGVRYLNWKRRVRNMYKQNKELSESVLKDIKKLDTTNERTI